MEGRIEICEKLINTILPCYGTIKTCFLTLFELEFDFMVFIRVVYNPLIFPMPLVSLNLEVYNSSYDKINETGSI